MDTAELDWGGVSECVGGTACGFLSLSRLAGRSIRCTRVSNESNFLFFMSFILFLFVEGNSECAGPAAVQRLLEWAAGVLAAFFCGCFFCAGIFAASAKCRMHSAVVG